jgi:transposase-like protein
MKQEQTENLQQLLEHFENTTSSSELLFQLKWPGGFVCPRCDHRFAYTISTRKHPLFECAHCKYQASLTVNTIFEGSSTDLSKWFVALYLFSTDEGTTAVRLQRAIHVTYKTAWLMLHKIRFAAGHQDAQQLLSGVVRIGAAFYGRSFHSSYEGHPEEHPILIGSGTSSQSPHEPGYIKMRVVSKEHMHHRRILRSGTHAFLKKEVAPATEEIRTVTERYSEQRFVHLIKHVVHASKWINRTFHGLGRKHLQAYLNEFCYRLNFENTSTQEESLMSNLLRLCFHSPRITYASLTKRS